MWDVEYFELPSGNCPVEQFLSKLDEEKDLPFILHVFSLGEKYGNELGRPHSAPLRDQIFEFRVSTKNGKFRFPYFFDKRTIVVTHGLKKQTNKIPNREIEKAIKYRNIYMERNYS